MNEHTYFNEIYQTDLLQHLHDADDIFKVVDSKVKVTGNSF